MVVGYTINEKRLQIAKHKYQELQKSIKLVANLISFEGIADETKGLIQVITEYSRALDILDDYDHQRLSVPKGTKHSKFTLTYDEAKKIIETMKQKFKDSSLVGQEKDSSFKSSIGAIDQTFRGKDLYPTVEEKATHFIIFCYQKSQFYRWQQTHSRSTVYLFFAEKWHSFTQKRQPSNRCQCSCFPNTHDRRQQTIRKRYND